MIDREVADHVLARLCYLTHREPREATMIWRAVSIGVLRRYGFLETPVVEQWLSAGHPVHSVKAA